MPGNKKPRKKYVPKKVKLRLGLNSRDMAGVKHILWRVAAISVMKLPQGICTDDDMACIQTLLLWSDYSVKHSNDLETVYREELLDVMSDGFLALERVAERFREKKTDRYVCYGDEMKALIKAVDYCREYMEYRMEHTPSKALGQWEQVWERRRRHWRPTRKINDDGSITEAPEEN